MRYLWLCNDCGASGSVDNRGMPVTTMVNLAAIQHRQKSPSCPTAAEADVQLAPGRCVFHALRPTPEGRKTDTLSELKE